ncbi:hypothetical protein [Shewanella algae]|uniref:hypothetical protein n=1 Tax=Shewanella algae TaxID=38313 RepID=UPI001AAD2691|nr:hypothetical protein [Shewanella algae]QTE84362.1 hypothetical protein JKK46_11205 [Shewanella algae]QTE84371.1 hypothetical protein JKK46_11250 [Shewanella algae]
MKRLFLTLGLVIAFFFSALSRADIYSQVSYQPPKRETVENGSCKSALLSGDIRMSRSDCSSYVEQTAIERYPYELGDLKAVETDYYGNLRVVYTIWCPSCSGSGAYIEAGTWLKLPSSETSTCPPDEFPNYIYEKDDDGDGLSDRCFDPTELDNASQCQNTVGSMLPALTNTASSVCVTDPTTGARCGFSRSNMGNSYQANLEMSCFGNDEIPEYTDEPMPEPETCTKMNSNLMVCVADPNEKCDFYGVCQDDCGYVNGQFYCFTPCVGAECDAETPPNVDCSATPEHPSCVPAEPEIPENCTKSGAGLICKEDPAEKCDEQGVCQDGCGYINGTFVCYQSPGSGGGLFDINIQPIVDELKALNKKFDFTTKVKESTKDLGKLGSIFSEDDINELKEKVSTTKEEIKTTISDIKLELANMFNVTSTGGAYVPPSIKTTFGDFTSNVWTFFVEYVHIIATVVMFIAYLVAARIVLT